MLGVDDGICTEVIPPVLGDLQDLHHMTDGYTGRAITTLTENEDEYEDKKMRSNMIPGSSWRL